MSSNPELAILTGLHESALARLATSVCLIGSSAGCDVMLSDAGIQPLHVSLSLGGAKLLMRRIRQVDAQPDTEAEGADLEHELSLYEPFQIGSVWAALVPAGFAWGASEPLPLPSSLEPEPEVELQPEPEEDLAPVSLVAITAPARPRWVAMTALVASCVVGLAFVATLAPASARGPVASVAALPASAAASGSAAVLTGRAAIDTAALRKVLDVLGLSGVTIEAGAARTVLVGFVSSREQLEALSQAIDRLPGERITMQVQVGAELAQRAKEFLGVPEVQASYAPTGRLLLSGRPVNLKSREILTKRVEQLAGDLGAAIRVDDRIDYSAIPDLAAAPKERPLNMRIVEVQADEPPHFRTSDGSMYFVGAKMPDGAEVMQIAAEEILFRKGDRQIAYRVLD